MALIKLERRVAMPEIMDAVAMQTGEGTDAPVEFVQPGG